MIHIPNIDEVTSWPQAIAMIVLVAGAVVIYRDNKKVKHQVFPNSGKSMYDVVKRTENTLNAHISDSLKNVEETVNTLKETSQRLDRLEHDRCKRWKCRVFRDKYKCLRYGRNREGDEK